MRMTWVCAAAALALGGCRDERTAAPVDERSEFPGNRTEGTLDPTRGATGAPADDMTVELTDVHVGKVQRVERGTLSLSLTSGDAVEVSLPEDARVYEDGKRVSLDAVKEGTDVRASYVEAEEGTGKSRPIVKRLDILK